MSEDYNKPLVEILGKAPERPLGFIDANERIKMAERVEEAWRLNKEYEDMHGTYDQVRRERLKDFDDWIKAYLFENRHEIARDKQANLKAWYEAKKLNDSNQLQKCPMCDQTFKHIGDYIQHKMKVHDSQLE